ncbi:MAG: hypothetical protein ACE37H_06340 [Phycisphaeraceae bacterium]
MNTDDTTPFRGSVRCSSCLAAAVLLFALAGCSPRQTPAKADLRATDTAGRVPALVDAAGRDDDRTLGELVRALSDDDAAVRLFAIQALNQRTGQTLGYRYYGSADDRRAAIARWHDWLDGDSPDATADADPD